MKSPELLKQGAEARLYRTTFCGRPAIVKERFRKMYRHPELDDAITTDRIKAEARALVRCRKLGEAELGVGLVGNGFCMPSCNGRCSVVSAVFIRLLKYYLSFSVSVFFIWLGQFTESCSILENGDVGIKFLINLNKR